MVSDSAQKRKLLGQGLIIKSPMAIYKHQYKHNKQTLAAVRYCPSTGNSWMDQKLIIIIKRPCRDNKQTLSTLEYFEPLV